MTWQFVQNYNKTASPPVPFVPEPRNTYVFDLVYNCSCVLQYDIDSIEVDEKFQLHTRRRFTAPILLRLSAYLSVWPIYVVMTVRKRDAQVRGR